MLGGVARVAPKAQGPIPHPLASHFFLLFYFAKYKSDLEMTF
jgi:hypothetical protein